LFFLLRRRWRVVTAGVASVVSLTLLTALLLGFESYRDYVVVAMPRLNGWRSALGNLSLFGIWSKLFDPSARVGLEMGKSTPLFRSPMLARVGTLACDAALIALLSRVVLRARSRAEEDHAFALCLPVALLVSPTLWDHYFVLLLLPVVLLWTTLPRSGVLRWDLRIIVLVLWLNPVIWWHLFVFDHSPHHGPTVYPPWTTLTGFAIPTYAVLGLFLLGVITSQRPGGMAGDEGIDPAAHRSIQGDPDATGASNNG
jgi:hypothetical protein